MTKEHKIGLGAATIASINGMIGAGIFTVPLKLAAQAGPAGIITYLFVIIAVWFMALTLARTAQEFPGEGSFYTYAKQWGGHTMGIIASSSYLIGLVIAMGLLSRIAGNYLHAVFPTVSASMFSYFVIIILTFINTLGLKLAQIGQTILICCTVGPILATTIICFLHADINNFYDFMPFGALNALAASKAVIFGFFGFECAASLFGVIKDPEKNIPKALTYSIIIVSILYIFFVMSIMLAIPTSVLKAAFEQDLSLPVVLADVFKNYPYMISIISIAIIIAVMGVIYTMIWSCGELLSSLTYRLEDKRFRLNSKSSVIAIGMAIFACYITLHSMDLFFSLTAIFILTAFMLSMISLLRRKKYIFSTSLGLITASVILLCAFQGLGVELNKKFVLTYSNKCQWGID